MHVNDLIIFVASDDLVACFVETSVFVVSLLVDKIVVRYSAPATHRCKFKQGNRDLSIEFRLRHIMQITKSPINNDHVSKFT